MKHLLLLFVLSGWYVMAGAQASTSYQFNGEQGVFTENRGQVVDQQGKPVPDILAKASVPGLDLYLTKTGVTYILLQYEEDLTAKSHPVYINEKKFKVKYSRVDVALSGASINAAQIQLTGEAGWKSNYYKTADANGQLAVAHFKNLTVQNVYPGIDWVWTFNALGKLEYDFIVHPGADPSLIKMQYTYADLKQAGNNLTINTRIGSLTEGPLQASNGSGKVQISYHVEASSKTVSFNATGYDKTKDLLIDPPLALNWSAQFGGSFLNGLRGVTTDNSGGVYLCGYTTSSDFPSFNPHGGAYFDSIYNGQSDAIILKLDTLQNLKYATFLGGPGNDFANSVCFASSGNYSSVLITGGAQSGFPIQGGYGNNSGQDAFMTGFNCSNLNLFYSSFYGGNGTDEGLKICVTPNGNFIYLVGYTNSTNNSFGGVSYGGYYQTSVTGQEAFVVKLNYNIIYGYVYTSWSTKFGGGGDDYATGVTIDSLNNVVVCGYTNSTNLPLVRADSAYYQNTNAGGYDGFIAKFNANNVLVNSTYYGGSGDDYFNDVATGLNGGFAFTGRTNSANFPLRAIGGFGYNQAHLADAAGDAFVIKAANNLTVKWATYFGGGSADVGTGITTDATGQMYVTGFTFSQNFPVRAFPGAYNQPTNHGNADAFIARFYDQGVQNWTTYKGDSCYQYPYSIAYDKVFNKFYVAGQGLLACLGDTMGQSLPDTGQVHNGVSSIGFAWSFNGQNNPSPLCPSINLNVEMVPCPHECNGEASIAPSGGTAPYNICWSNGNNTDTARNLCAGTFWVEVKDSVGCVVEFDSQLRPLAIRDTGIYVSCSHMQDIVYANSGNITSPYSYHWSTSPGYSDSSSIYITPGNYFVTVMDANGCTASSSVQMHPYNTYYYAGNVYIDGYPSCNDGFSSVQVNVYDNFSQGSWLWPNGHTTAGSTIGSIYSSDNVSLSPSPPGTVYVFADSGGCLNGNRYIMHYNLPLPGISQKFNLNESDVTSCRSADGSISLNMDFIPTCIVTDSAGNTIGSAVLSVGSGYDNVTVSWSDGVQSGSRYYFNFNTPDTITGLSAGDYWVTVSSGSRDQYVYELQVGGANPVVYGTQVIPAGCIASTGNINLGGIYGDGESYTFLWSNGSTEMNLRNLSVGPYSVTITGDSGCASYYSYYVNADRPIIVTDNYTPAICYQPNLTFTVTATGGTPPYIGTGIFHEPSVNSIMSISVSDSLGCYATDNLHITVPSQLRITENISRIYCYGGNATITITATGGHPPYIGTGTFRKTAGNYIFTVTDSLGCSINDTVHITQPQQLTVSLSAFGISCSPGSVTAYVNGGSPSYVFRWSTSQGNYVSGSSIIVSDTGTCRVTVTDAEGCTATGSTIIPYYPTTFDPVSIGVNGYPTCDDTSTYIQFGVGVQNVLWTWPDGHVTDGGFIGGYPGIYPSYLGAVSVSQPGTHYMVTDSSECVSGHRYILHYTFALPDILSFASLSETQPTNCTSPNGTIAAGFDIQDNPQILCTISDSAGNVVGTEPLIFYSYLTLDLDVRYKWSTGATSASITNLAPDVTYTVTVTFDNCDTTILSTQLYVSAIPALDQYTVTPANCSGTGGGIDILQVSSGGGPPYSYLWSNGQTTDTATNLSTGTYWVTTTGQNGCHSIASFNVPSTQPFIVTSTYPPIPCHGDSTTLTITATGGHPPYTGTGMFRETAGTYLFVITDSLGCSVIDTVVVTQPAQLSVSVNSQGITCSPSSVSASVSGGTGIYQYYWNTSPVNSSTIYVTFPSDYEVTITDANGCSATADRNVTYYNLPYVIDSVFYLQLPGCGLSNGVAYINAADPSKITWQTDSGSFYGDTLRNIQSATSSTRHLALTIIDSSNCQNGHIEPVLYLFDQYYIDYNLYSRYPTGCNTKDGVVGAENFSPFYSGYTPRVFVNMPNTQMASIFPVTIAKFQPVTYQWSNGEVYSGYLNSSYFPTYIDSLNAGVYTVTITDGACQFILSDTLNDTTHQVVAHYNVTEPGCNISSSGSIHLNGLDNNISHLLTQYVDTFAWSNGATTQSIGNLSDGIYTVSITGPNACPVLDTFGLAAPQLLILSDTISQTSACYNGIATIKIVATGGTPPYTGTGNLFEPPGMHVFIVTDSNGCSAKDTLLVPYGSGVQILVSNTNAPILCYGDSTTLTISATGGHPPYFGTGTFQKPAGSYVLTVTDSVGCSVNDSVLIIQPAILSVSNSVSEVLCYGGNATINITCIGGTGQYIGTGTYTKPAGSYVFLITDANGCVVADSINVTQPTPIVITDTVSEVRCFGGRATVVLTATGGTGPYIGTGTFLEPAGNNLLVISDQHGCLDSVSLNITEPRLINIHVQLLDSNAHCSDSIKALITASGGAGNYNGTGIITYTQSATYTVIVNDGRGCQVDTAIHIHIDTCTGTENTVADGDVSVYPNPAADKFYVKFASPVTEQTALRLFTIDGKLVAVLNMPANGILTEVNCNQLASGVYILRTVVLNKEYNFKVVLTK